MGSIFVIPEHSSNAIYLWNAQYLWRVGKARKAISYVLSLVKNLILSFIG